MPDYSKIYDNIISEHLGYNTPIGSPGFRLALQNEDKLKLAGKRHLDIGCGVGFVVELMRSPIFNKESLGVDISQHAISKANKRMEGNYTQVMQNGSIPFGDKSFDLITCFDVLEHLDASDIKLLNDEMNRVSIKGTTLFCNISLRAAGSVDFNGDNLHRTIETPDWWDSIFNFDEFTVNKHYQEMTAWKKYK